MNQSVRKETRDVHGRGEMPERVVRARGDLTLGPFDPLTIYAISPASQ